MNRALYLVCIILLFLSCKNEKLPILGETTLNDKGDIMFYKTPEFEMINQNKTLVNHKKFNGKVKVVDFFFTSCPTICPVMTNHLKLVEKAFRNNNDVNIISFTIDPKNDSPDRLKTYSNQFNINSDNWFFLTSDNNSVFEIAKDFKVRAFNDNYNLESDLIHDGTFVLVDTESRIRGYYDGLSIEDTNRLINDIEILLKNG